MLAPETEPLPLDVLPDLEKVEDLAVRAEIDSFLRAHANTDLGGLEITEANSICARRAGPPVRSAGWPQSRRRQRPGDMQASCNLRLPFVR